MSYSSPLILFEKIVVNVHLLNHWEQIERYIFDDTSVISVNYSEKIIIVERPILDGKVIVDSEDLTMKIDEYAKNFWNDEISNAQIDIQNNAENKSLEFARSYISSQIGQLEIIIRKFKTSSNKNAIIQYMVNSLTELKLNLKLYYQSFNEKKEKIRSPKKIKNISDSKRIKSIELDLNNLNHYQKTKSINLFCNYLIVLGLIGGEYKQNMYDIFWGDSISEQILWKGQLNELKYLFSDLKKRGLIKKTEDSNKIWSLVAEIFFIKDKEINANKLRTQPALKDKIKIQEINTLIDSFYKK